MRIPSGAIPENIRRCMTKEERKEMRTPTSEEAQSKIDLRTERDIHKQFLNWCSRNGIMVRHQRTDRKTSEEKGWPDFQCVKKGRVCWVEFKLGLNKLTDEQEEMIRRLRLNGFSVFETNSYHCATTWVGDFLGLWE